MRRYLRSVLLAVAFSEYETAIVCVHQSLARQAPTFSRSSYKCLRTLCAALVGAARAHVGVLVAGQDSRTPRCSAKSLPFAAAKFECRWPENSCQVRLDGSTQKDLFSACHRTALACRFPPPTRRFTDVPVISRLGRSPFHRRERTSPAWVILSGETVEFVDS